MSQAERENTDIVASVSDVEIIATVNQSGGGVNGPSKYSNETSPLLSPSSSSDESAEHQNWDEFGDKPWYKTPSIAWLLPPFVLFTLAFGMIAVPKLNLILALVCREYFASPEYFKLHGNDTILVPVIIGQENPQCQIPEVSAIAARFVLYTTLIVGSIGALTAPRLGALSDRYGRTIFIALSSMGLGTSEIISIIASKYPDTFSINFFLLGAALDGLCGSVTLGMAMAHTYAADVTEPARRGVAFGRFHASLFIGIAVGPAIGGFIIQKTGEVLSAFYLALAFHVFFVFIVLFFVPESLSKRRQLLHRSAFKAEQAKRHSDSLRNEENGSDASSGWKKYLRYVNGVHLLEPLAILWPTGPGTTKKLRRNLFLLAAVDTIGFGIMMGSMTVVIYYAGVVFKWDSVDSSYYMAIASSTRVSVLLVVFPLLTRQFRKNVMNKNTGADTLDVSIIRICIIIETVGYTVFAVAKNGTVFTIAGCINALGGIGAPTLQSTMTKHVPRAQTGQLLGASALLHSLARVVGPIVFNNIYSSTVETRPQTVFICLASTWIVAFLCALFVSKGVYAKEGAELREHIANETRGDAAT